MCLSLLRFTQFNSNFMDTKKSPCSKQSMLTFFHCSSFSLFFPVPPMAMVSDTDVFGNEMAPSKCKANIGSCFFTCASGYEEFILSPGFDSFQPFFVHEKLLFEISCISSPVYWYIVSRFVGARSFFPSCFCQICIDKSLHL